MKKKVGLTKVVAGNAPKTVWAADITWKGSVKPAALYGAEIINYTKTWVKEMERIQNKLGRWILGTSQSAASAGVRGELGWTTIQGEIEEK